MTNASPSLRDLCLKKKKKKSICPGSDRNFRTCQLAKFSSVEMRRGGGVFRIDLCSRAEQVWEHLSGSSHMSAGCVREGDSRGWQPQLQCTCRDWKCESVIVWCGLVHRQVLRSLSWLERKRSDWHSSTRISRVLSLTDSLSFFLSYLIAASDPHLVWCTEDGKCTVYVPVISFQESLWEWNQSVCLRDIPPAFPNTSVFPLWNTFW